jgi:hypothetical protein
MMVNPHNILVVFGQDLSVQGRVTNAAINFAKFNNQMVPERLRIGLQMKALYIGPVQTVPNYSLYNNEATSSATIPYENSSVSVEVESVKFAALTKATTASSFGVGVGVAAGVGTNPVNGSGDETTFATNLLIALSFPVTAANTAAIVAWERAEGGMPHNNPLNTTQDMPGATDFNDVGVKTYVDLTQGLRATVITLTNGLYDNILAALKDGVSACSVAYAVAHSPWGTGSLMQQILGC